MITNQDIIEVEYICLMFGLRTNYLYDFNFGIKMKREADRKVKELLTNLNINHGKH